MYPGKDRKVISVAPTEKEKHTQIGTQREKGLVYDTYYSCDLHYYVVDIDFEFVKT